MSGGSYDYLYQRVEEFSYSIWHQKTSALRAAFSAHLRKVAKAMHDIEWVDSCDYAKGDEMSAIRDVLGITDEENRRLEEMDEIIKGLNSRIEALYGPKEVQHGQS